MSSELVIIVFSSFCGFNEKAYKKRMTIICY